MATKPEKNRKYYRKCLDKCATDCTELRLFVDTLVDVSVVSLFFHQYKYRGYKIQHFVANESPIHTFGECFITVHLLLKRNFQWQFILASILIPIIGADFLHKFSLMVDIINCCIEH